MKLSENNLLISLAHMHTDGCWVNVMLCELKQCVSEGSVGSTRSGQPLKEKTKVSGRWVVNLQTLDADQVTNSSAMKEEGKCLLQEIHQYNMKVTSHFNFRGGERLLVI